MYVSVCSCLFCVSTAAVVDEPVGNNSCFTMVMTNWFWAQQQMRNYHAFFPRFCVVSDELGRLRCCKLSAVIIIAAVVVFDVAAISVVVVAVVVAVVVVIVVVVVLVVVIAIVVSI